MFHNEKDRCISARKILQLRFGKGLDFIQEQMPENAIISFFCYNTYLISQRYNLINHFKWFNHQAYYYLLSFSSFSENSKKNSLALMSIGIGASFLSMIIEELIVCGVKNIIAIGFAGTLNSKINACDLVLPISSIMEDGVSVFYLKNESVVFPSSILVQKIEKNLEKSNFIYHKGKSLSIISPYCETFTNMEMHKNNSVLCVDMESASLFAVSSCYNINSAAIFTISDRIEKFSWTPFFKKSLLKKRKWQLLQLAIDSLLL